MADVFLSYAREDSARAAQIARGLESMGLEVFWDNEIPPGQTWADYIEGKLAICKTVIVLWSASSTKSQWVREEARMGRDKSKLIPVIIDGSAAPFGFGEVQAADLSSWNGDAGHPGWQRFSQAVYSAAKGADATAPRAAAAPVYTPPPRVQAAAYTGAGAGAVEQLSPVDYVMKCFRLYFDGKGRARRAEYWWWVLFSVIVSFVTSIIDMGFGVDPYTQQPNSQIISTLAGLAILAPGIAVTARRFHDVNLSGWLVAAFYVAYFIGAFMLGVGSAQGTTSNDYTVAGIAVVLLLIALVTQLVITVMPSRPGENQYGPNPKGE